MKIKGSSVAAIGIGAFLTGVAAGVAACRKDALRAAGQFFGGVVSGAGAVAVAVATAESSYQVERGRMEQRDLVRRYIALQEARAQEAVLLHLLGYMTFAEREYVRARYGV